MGQRSSRDSSERDGGLRAGKASAIFVVGVCGWIHFESLATGPNSQRSSSTAHGSSKTRGVDLWRREVVPIGPGRAARLKSRWRPIVDVPPSLSDLEPSHVANCLGSTRQRISYRVLKPLRRRAN